jgi:hypothetical protein
LLWQLQAASPSLHTHISLQCNMNYLKWRSENQSIWTSFRDSLYVMLPVYMAHWWSYNVSCELDVTEQWAAAEKYCSDFSLCVTYHKKSN